jgi:teichuronic acid biosynthesis glycosyltransferase TuaG
MLITDDGSKDNSVSTIKRIFREESRIRLFELQKNVGAAEARNVALSQAKGRYIAFLDSDDIWYPKKLEKQLVFMQKNGYAFTFTSYNQMNEFGVDLNKIIQVPQSINYNQYLRNTIIGCLTVIIDKKRTGDFGMPLIKSSHDMALWLLIMKRGFKAYGLNEVLATYRIVSNSNTSKKWKAAKDVWRVYRQIEHLSFFIAIFNFCGYIFNAIKKRI